MSLRVDWCSHEAAVYAVRRWHYSRRMPRSKLVRIGVWEDDRFCGAILYGLGAGRAGLLGSPYGLAATEAAELVRVALAPRRRHPTSKSVAISLRLLRRQSPGLKLVVSFADSGRGHVGTIYQAGGWIHVGVSLQSYIKVRGEIVHPRTLYDRYGGATGQSIPWLREHVDPRACRVEMAPKLKYLMPFDSALRKQLEALALPFPKHADEATGVAAGDQPDQGGSIPTRPLQIP